MTFAEVQPMLEKVGFEYHARTANTLIMVHFVDLKAHLIIVDDILLICVQTIGAPSRDYRRCTLAELFDTIGSIVEAL